MRIILYSKHVRNVSGIQTFERAFLQSFNKLHEITYLYDVGDIETINEFKQWANVVRNNDQVIEGDVCIYSTVFTENPNIRVKKRIQVVHTDLTAFGVSLKNKNIDTYVAVSEFVQGKLKKDFNIDSVVIYNLMPEREYSNTLRLMTASRIAQGKGFERVSEFVRKLSEHGRPFIYEIYGVGSMAYEDKIRRLLSNYEDVVHFMGWKADIQSYMMANDFVVQLSDSEGFCYSIHEALQVNVPVIVTDWQGVRNSVEDGVNGFVLQHDLSNLDIEKLYNFEKTFVSFPKNIEYNVKNSLQNWQKVFNN